MNIQIDNKDLNMIDKMNGTGNVSSKTPVMGLKGALATYNAINLKYQARIYKQHVLNQYVRFMSERYDYENLPEEIDKYILEKKILENGSALMIKVNDKLYAVNYSVQTWDMYNRPSIVIVNEPKSRFLNGMKFDLLEEDCAIIRNNMQLEDSITPLYRLIEAMERVLFQIERNIQAAAPKGIVVEDGYQLVTGDNEDNPDAETLESALNSERIFISLKGTNKLKDKKAEEIFIPIQFDDRIDQLIRHFTFFEEKIKEAVGGGSNIHQKKERVNTEEIGQQREASNGFKSHAIKIRQLDLIKVNKYLNYDIQLIGVETEEEITDSSALEAGDESEEL